LKEADCCIRRVWRLVRIKPEVIQRAEANRVGVRILCKSFRAPSYRTGRLNTPRRAAISSISLGAIIRPTGFLTRGVKPDVRDVYSWARRYAKRLDRAIEVL